MHSIYNLCDVMELEEGGGYEWEGGGVRSCWSYHLQPAYDKLKSQLCGTSQPYHVRQHNSMQFIY